MESKDLLLAIDCGTQSLRTLLFDLQGHLVAKEIVSYPPYYSIQPGWAEQDPDTFWEAFCRACQGLWQNTKHARQRIAGMALTTQRGTVVNVDQSGKPLRPAIIWLDQRRTQGLPALKGTWGLLFSALGLSDTIAYFQAEAEANWIYTHQPDIWDKTYKYLLLSGYLTYRLTDEFVDSIGCQVGYIPFNYKRLCWEFTRNWKWRILPITRQQLPELTSPGSILGYVTHAAAVATGLPEGLPVIAAAADKACEVIGSGSIDPSIGCISYGTTATINVTHPKYIEAIPLIPPYPSAIPKRYSIEIQIYRGYWMIRWFKKEFGLLERQQAAKKGVAPEALFEKLVEQIPPGSMGLMLQPFWSPGLRHPGPEAKGAIIGFGDIHNRAHVYRSILEGLAYALREGKERIEKKTHVPITSLRVSGGGSRSRSALQLTADIFGLLTARNQTDETSGLGAAIVAAVGLGLHRSFATAVKEMTRIGEVFEPKMENQKLYDDLYQHVYKKMYRQLKPLYRRIRKITGYPK